MTSINRLTQQAALNDNDLIPIWSGYSGRTMNVPAHAIKEFVKDSIHDATGVKLVSGTYANGTLTLKLSDNSEVVVTGWADLTGIDFKEDGVNVGTFTSVNFKGNAVQASKNGDSLDVTINTAASAPTLALQFSGIYDTLQDLKDAVDKPSDNMQAIVIKPSEKYYHSVGGSWVELAPVGSFHPNYLGAFDTVDDLKAAEPTPTDDSLAIVGTAAKAFYIYTSGQWELVTHTDLPSLDARVTDAEAKITALESKDSDHDSRLTVAEGHLDDLRQEDTKIRDELSQSVQTLNSDIAQKPDGLTLTNKDGTQLADLTSLKLDGAEIVDNGDGTFTLKSASQIAVADGQGLGSHSESGNALIFEGSQVSADPNDSNVIRIAVHAATHEGINVGDGVNASRAVQTIKFPGHQAYGSGDEASIHIECLHFANKDELTEWAAKFGSVMDFDSVAVVDDDGNGFVGWYKFDAATKTVKDYAAQGMIVSDLNGAAPKNIKTMIFGQGFEVNQAGDQEDAVTVTYTETGGGSSSININSQPITDLYTEYPIQVDNQQGQDRLLIDPNAFENQHANSCLLELDHPIHTQADQETELYLSHEIVPTGEYFSLNPAARGVNVQDNSGGDTAATGGQLTRIMAAVSFFGKANSNGNVKIWVYYKDPVTQQAGILTGVDGHPMVVERYYNQGEDLSAEPLIIASAMMATGQAPIVLKIESTLEVEVNPVKTLLCIEQFANGFQTSIASIEFQRRMGLELHAETKTFKQKEVELKNELVAMDEPLTNVPANSGGDYLNDFGVQNNTKVMASIINGAFSISANGVPADYYIDVEIDNVQTQMLRGHDIMYSANFQNRNDAYRLEVYAWTGKPDEMPKVWTGWNNTEPTIATGYTLVKSKFQQEQIDGLYRDVLDTATVPDNANNIVILIRPVVKSDPSIISIKDFWWGVPHALTGYVEVGRYKVDEMHFKFDKGYGEFYLDSQGYTEIRYTINNDAEGNPLPVGVMMKGKAPVERDSTVNIVAGSQVPQFDGAIKFTKDGEAKIGHTYTVWNEHLTDNTVTFWDNLIDADGNATKIPQSEKTFTVPKGKTVDGKIQPSTTVFSIPAYTVEVETGQRIGARASSNIKDGAFLQSVKGGQYLTQTVVEFDELIADASDAPDLVSAPLNKLLVDDNRVYPFSGNTSNIVTISNVDIPADVEMFTHSVVSKIGNVITSVEGTKFQYDGDAQTIKVTGLSAVSNGKIYIGFKA